jgi:hypothetical protein
MNMGQLYTTCQYTKLIKTMLHELTSWAGTPKLGSAILACIAERVDAPVALDNWLEVEALSEDTICPVTDSNTVSAFSPR